MSSKEHKNADIARGERMTERSKRVNQLEPLEWKEQVKEFEKLFLEYIEQNKNFEGNLYMKWLNDTGVIRAESYIPLAFTVCDIARYELAQMKWDSLQTLRIKRKYAQEKEIEAMENIALGISN